MPWSKPQRVTAGIAARAAGWNDEQRQMMLRRFDNRAMHNGRLTSTSPKLNQDDFEIFMSIAEAHAGGQLPKSDPAHWLKKSNQAIARQRNVIERMANSLYIEKHISGENQLNAIIAQATGHKAGSLAELDQLDDRTLAGNVISALRAIGHRNGITWMDEKPSNRSETS